MAWEEFGDLFRQLGLSQKVNQFWAAARAGNTARATQLLKEIETVLSRTRNLRAAAGTLARARAAVQALLETAEVTTEVIGEATVLTAEAEGLLGTGAAVAGGGAVLEAEAPLAATGPPGWAVIAVTLLIVLALAAMAHAEEAPPPPKRAPPRNPFQDLPPSMRNDPNINPAAKLNKEMPKKFKEYQEKVKRKCRCYGMAPLGGNIAGRSLAFGMAPPSRNQCTWPNCPKQNARA